MTKRHPSVPDIPKLTPVRASDDTCIERSITTMLDDGATFQRLRDLKPGLVVMTGTAVGALLRLDGTSMTLGRSPECDMTVDAKGVSRVHCRFVTRGDIVVVEDMGSTNGTYVNYERVSSQVLRDGDRLRLGQSSLLKFSYHDDEELQAQEQLYEAAMRDPLTGAFNKRYFETRVTSEIAYAHRHKVPLSLILIDIDHFKRINDTFGHPAGDAALVQLVELLRARFRLEDVLARVGGEEFAVLARSLDERQVFEFADRLRSLISEHRFRDRTVEVPVTISAGTATVPAGQEIPVADLFRQADRALYAAKQNGRNRVEPRPGR